jgi:hypothetical protein
MEHPLQVQSKVFFDVQIFFRQSSYHFSS